MNLFVVISTELVLLLWSPAAQWLLEIRLGVFAADHKADLARRVGWDRSVGIFDNWEDLLAGGFEFSDQWEM